MKPICLWLLVSAASAVLGGDSRSSDGYPSAVSPSMRGLSAADAFILERSDFRLLFCDAATVRSRIAAAQCIVDGRPRAGVRGRFIPVAAGRTLREVLKDVGLQSWSGGQPQIRVIQRNEIRQSERPDGIAPAPFDVKHFLDGVILPGDLVVLAMEW
jgi:hypothetical protein